MGASKRKLVLISSIIKKSSYEQMKEPDYSTGGVINYSIVTEYSLSKGDQDSENKSLLQRVTAEFDAVENSEDSEIFDKDTSTVMACSAEFVNVYSSKCVIDKNNMDDIVAENIEYIKAIADTLAHEYIRRALRDTFMAGMKVPYSFKREIDST